MTNQMVVLSYLLTIIIKGIINLIFSVVCYDIIVLLQMGIGVGCVRLGMMVRLFRFIFLFVGARGAGNFLSFRRIFLVIIRCFGCLITVGLLGFRCFILVLMLLLPILNTIT